MQTMRAREVMTPNVLSISDSLTLEEAARFLSDNAISGAPVINDSAKLVGVVSLTDIARAISDANSGPQLEYSVYLREPEFSAEHFASLQLEQRSEVTVRDIMTPMIFQVSAQADVGEIAETMTRGRIHRVFVTQEGALVGVVSALDLLKHFRELTESLQRTRDDD